MSITSISSLQSKISVLEERLVNAQSMASDAARIKHAQEKHSIEIFKQYMTAQIEKESSRSEGEDDIVEIDFGRLNVEVTQEFGPQDSCALKVCSPGEVIPDFVNYLLTCQREGQGDEDYFFHTDGEMWFVADIDLTGKGHKLVKTHFGPASTSHLKWMYLSVKFEKIEQRECCVCGDTYPISQMVTNGDDWMSKDVWGGFE